MVQKVLIMPLSRDLRNLGSVGRSPVLGLHRVIDDRFGPVPGSRSESLTFNFRAEEAGLAVPAPSSSAGCLAVMGCDHGICKLVGERGDRNKCTRQGLERRQPQFLRARTGRVEREAEAGYSVG